MATRDDSHRQAISDEELAVTARLAAFRLAPEEVKGLRAALSTFVEYCSIIQAIEHTGEETTVIERKCEFGALQNDIDLQSGTADALGNVAVLTGLAPDFDEERFFVPRVVG